MQTLKITIPQSIVCHQNFSSIKHDRQDKSIHTNIDKIDEMSLLEAST